jgi:hypothetical protein
MNVVSPSEERRWVLGGGGFPPPERVRNVGRPGDGVEAVLVREAAVVDEAGRGVHDDQLARVASGGQGLLGIGPPPP